jgi:hypothetical protein
MTPEQWNRVCQLVVELSQNETAGDDLTDVVLAAAYRLPENVRLRELREQRQARPAKAS